MRRSLLALATVAMLGGCAAESVWAPDDVVSKATYRHDGPPRLTVFTMINNKSGAGAHTSLMVNASQRVIFDPAGSFEVKQIPERNDVIFGVTPKVADFYTRYHARETFRVKVQKLDVSPALAERALRLVQTYGPVPSAQCSRSTSSILAELFPGQIGQTWYPKKLAAEFAQISGVTEQELYEYDSDDNSRVLKEWVPNAY